MQNAQLLRPTNSRKDQFCSQDPQHTRHKPAPNLLISWHSGSKPLLLARLRYEKMPRALPDPLEMPRVPLYNKHEKTREYASRVDEQIFTARLRQISWYCMMQGARRQRVRKACLYQAGIALRRAVEPNNN